jgi:hypothetical protein
MARPSQYAHKEWDGPPNLSLVLLVYGRKTRAMLGTCRSSWIT